MRWDHVLRTLLAICYVSRPFKKSHVDHKHVKRDGVSVNGICSNEQFRKYFRGICSPYILFVAVFLGYNQYWPGEFMVLWFYVQEHPKAQPAVVLILKGPLL